MVLVYICIIKISYLPVLLITTPFCINTYVFQTRHPDEVRSIRVCFSSDEDPRIYANRKLLHIVYIAKHAHLPICIVCPVMDEFLAIVVYTSAVSSKSGYRFPVSKCSSPNHDPSICVWVLVLVLIWSQYLQFF